MITPARRRWLLGGTAIAAGAAGIGWSWWRRRGENAAADTLWTLSFPQPDGGELAFGSLRGRPWVLNFWATWCPPCIKEMPELDRFHRSHAAAGWQVIGLAVDGPTPVREFLQRRPVGYPIALAGFGGTELGKALGNTRGALPFTAVFDRRGRIVQRKLGETNFEELAGWARSIE